MDGRRYVSRSPPVKCVAQLSRFPEQRKMIGDRGMFPSRLVRGGPTKPTSVGEYDALRRFGDGTCYGITREVRVDAIRALMRLGG